MFWDSLHGSCVDPDGVAMMDGTEKMSFNAVGELADTICAHVPSRSLVFLVATNTIPSVVGYLGFLAHGIVPLMLRPETSIEQFRELVAAYNPSFLWMPKPYADNILEAHEPAINLFESRGYALVSTGCGQVPIHPDLAMLITTSGSTGTPKYVRLSYQNVASNAESIANYQGITSSDRAITSLPLSYTYGISIINSHILRGASLVLTDETIMSRTFWNLLKRYGATNFGGVPYTYQMLERLRFSRMDLPTLRFISQAGGRLGERLQKVFGEACAEKGIDFYVMYGQTEATARMSWLPPQNVLKKLGSIGIAIPGGRFELRDVSDALIEVPGVDGELIYVGPNVSMGYAESAADLMLGDERGGILHTGDVARRDEDGYYYVVGRIKRFLKMFGNRVNLDELEAIFAQRGQTIACVGSDDHMVVYATEGDVNELRLSIASFTKLHPSAFDVRIVDELPRMASGKMDYAALERLC